MRLLDFLIFSSIEFAAIMVLTLTIFMFSLRSYLANIVFSSIILAQVSYFLIVESHQDAIAPIIQMVIFILFLWLMFRIQIFYACFMVIIGYLVYSLLQGLLAITFEWFHLFTLEDAIKNNSLGYLLQFTSSLLVAIICFLLKKYRIGFSFIPDSERAPVIFKGENIRFLIVMFFALIMIAFFYLYSLTGITHLIIVTCLFGLLLGLLVYLSLKKEDKG